MPGDTDVLNATNGYETAHCFIGDALKTHAQRTADSLHVTSGPIWIEDAKEHPGSFLHWAVPCVYEALLDSPPAAIVDEIRVIVATRSPEVLWALFDEEVQIALKLRGTFSPHSRPLQRWTRASKLFSRELKTTNKWRSGDALVAEARSREAEVAMQLLGEAREYMFREGLSLQRNAVRAAREMKEQGLSPVTSPLAAETGAMTDALESIAQLQRQKQQLEKELDEVKAKAASAHSTELALDSSQRDVQQLRLLQQKTQIALQAEQLRSEQVATEQARLQQQNGDLESDVQQLHLLQQKTEIALQAEQLRSEQVAAEQAREEKAAKREIEIKYQNDQADLSQLREQVAQLQVNTASLNHKTALAHQLELEVASLNSQCDKYRKQAEALTLELQQTRSASAASERERAHIASLARNARLQAASAVNLSSAVSPPHHYMSPSSSPSASPSLGKGIPHQMNITPEAYATSTTPTATSLNLSPELRSGYQSGTASPSNRS